MTNVTFLEADVQTYPFKPEYDFCFSRFGTQFFENPVAGLRNMRVALKPDGIMTMIVWRARAEEGIGKICPFERRGDGFKLLDGDGEKPGVTMPRT